MRLHSVAGMLAAAAAAGGLFAGCGSNTNTSLTTAPPAPTSAPAGQQHNLADVVFLQNMIHHHSHAVTMSQTARNQATSPQVKDLAARIETAQSSEIQQMSGLLTAWGTPAPTTPGGMGGTGHGQMPGMTSGAGFDRMFLQMMVVQHQGAVEMARTELAQGSNPDTRHLAQQIISAQQAEISEMQTLLQVI